MSQVAVMWPDSLEMMWLCGRQNTNHISAIVGMQIPFLSMIFVQSFCYAHKFNYWKISSHRCQDGVLWCGATLHDRADRLASAPQAVRLDKTSDPPGSGVSRETGSRAPVAFLWQSHSPAQGSYLCSSGCTFFLILFIFLSHLSYHTDSSSRCCTVPQQQLRCLVPTLVPTWRSSEVVRVWPGRRGLGSGRESGRVHEVKACFTSSCFAVITLFLFFLLQKANRNEWLI